MPTKNPRIQMTFADKEDYARISRLLLKEYKSVNEGLREALNAWLRSRGEEPLKELEWGGNRTGTKGGNKKRIVK
jgi:hypothetical protein